MSLEGKHIVAIDDTPSIRKFLRISLENMGANFHEAGTAEDGLRLTKELSPDIVVLDLGLPDRDGLDILPEIKESQENGDPTVIVLTVRKELSYKTEAKKKGADAYLTKPFMMHELIEVIEEQLDKSH